MNICSSLVFYRSLRPFTAITIPPHLKDNIFYTSLFPGSSDPSEFYSSISVLVVLVISYFSWSILQLNIYSCVRYTCPAQLIVLFFNISIIIFSLPNISVRSMFFLLAYAQVLWILHDFSIFNYGGLCLTCIDWYIYIIRRQCSSSVYFSVT